MDLRGGWGPRWLVNTLENDVRRRFPHDIAVRLRSAVVPPGALHGWDMNIGKYGAPKWMRKRAGRLGYFLELQEPGQAG
jgi:hypothetical protein